MEDRQANNATDFIFRTRRNDCNMYSKATPRDREVSLHHGSHNISLHQACEDGRLCTVQYILSQRPADINARDKLGRTPVVAAVMKHQVLVFDFLVNRNCDLKALDNNNDTVLHVACGFGNVDIVKKLVFNHKCNIDSRNGKGMTPAMKSAMHGHVDVLDLLIGKGCNVTTLDDNMNNILHVACSGGHVDMVKYILRKLHSDIESRGEKGRTSIMIAAHSGRIGVFDLLASKGSNLFAVDDNKDNILHVACIDGHVDMVQHILNKTSIDIESKGKRGQTPVMRAARYGQISVVDFLVSKHCNLRAVDKSRNTLLHVACLGGRLAMVKHILLKIKFLIDSRGWLGQTPVITAAREGHINVVKYLVNKGCDLTIFSNQRYTSLHVACIYGHVNVVKYILSQQKISIESVGKFHCTPVMIAVIRGHLNLVKYLVRTGGKLTTIDNVRNTVLHMACMKGHTDIVKYILTQTKILTESRGRLGWTPVMYAASYCHTSVFMFLVKEGSNLKTVTDSKNNILHVACMGGCIDIVKYIVEKHVLGIESRGENGWTSVMSAASKGRESVFLFIVKQGCRLMILDKSKDNILHVACMGGNVNIVKYIVEKLKIGIDSRRLRERKWTPVMAAAFFGHKSVVKFLVGKGCNIWKVDDKGRNVLDYACRGGKRDVVKYLITIKSWSKTC